MTLKYSIVRTDDDIRYFRYGADHRYNGPAVINIFASFYSRYSLYYSQYGELHRTDGPAAILRDGEKYYFIRGRGYNRRDYESKIRS